MCSRRMIVHLESSFFREFSIREPAHSLRQVQGIVVPEIELPKRLEVVDAPRISTVTTETLRGREG
jgi:hypothetical protein